jgi:glyoxylate reductase/D-3-phosphoglycerate dehydrogenase
MSTAKTAKTKRTEAKAPNKSKRPITHHSSLITGCASRPVIVVEDDPFPRLLQVILDPSTPAARAAAFAHFFAHEEPDFAGWCERLRGRLKRLYPAQVRLVDDQASLLAAMPGARAVIVESLAVGKKEIAAAGKTLRIAQKYGTVLENFDAAACRRAGVRVLTLRRRVNISCTEHAYALMLALARKIHETAGLISVEQLQAAGYSPTKYDREHTANANWARITGTRNLYGRQIGLVGFGEIGREMAVRAAAFGMRIVYTRRHRMTKAEESRYGATYAPLGELLAASDFVSLHLPLNDATRGIIGRRELGQIKPGAILVNISRPPLVDREALLEALRAGRLGGFGLDPHYDAPGRADDPLLGFRNVIITPHLAGSPRFNSLNDFEELLLGLDRALARIG